MADDLTPRDVGPQAGDPVTDFRDGAPGVTKAASLDHALQHRKAPGSPRYQYREIGEGEGWRDCSKFSYDRFASDPNVDTRELPAAVAQPAPSTAAQVMTEQFHRSGLPAEVQVVDAVPEGVEPVKVARS
jgi:hypothetical protein